MFGFGTAGRTIDQNARLLAGLIRRGARGGVASEWVAQAAHNTDGHDPLGMARFLAERFKRQVAYAEDEYGRDDPQTLEETVDRTAGDCEDFAVALCALALRAGARVALAFLLTPEGAPRHVMPLVERTNTTGVWEPFEITIRGVQPGTWPHPPAEYVIVEIVPAAGPGLGFLEEIFSGIANVVTGNQQAKAIKSQAKATTAAAAIEARGTVDAAKETRAAVEFQEKARTQRLQMLAQAAKDVAPALAWATAATVAIPLVTKLFGRRRK